MTSKQLTKVAEIQTSPSQEMSQAEAENLVDQLYTQHLVANGIASLVSHAPHERRTTQSLQEWSSQPSEALATLLSDPVETYLRFFFAPLFFVCERAGKIESGDGRDQETAI
jgi:hypothetical protein